MQYFVFGGMLKYDWDNVFSSPFSLGVYDNKKDVINAINTEFEQIIDAEVYARFDDVYDNTDEINEFVNSFVVELDENFDEIVGTDVDVASLSYNVGNDAESMEEKIKVLIME